jgi:hypothetical protein
MPPLTDKYVTDPEGKLDLEALQRMMDRVNELDEQQIAERTDQVANITLAAGLAAYGAPFTVPRYLVRSGVLFTEGLANIVANVAAGTTVAVLPFESADRRVRFFDSSVGPLRADLFPDGTIRNEAAWTAGTWIDLATAPYVLA